MNEREYLLTCLIEELSEVQKAATKALRFGVDDHWQDEPTNRVLMRLEMLDVLCLASMLRERHNIELFNFASNADMRHMREKEAKMDRFMEYARKAGTLQ